MRFTVPDNSLDRNKRIAEMNEQFDEYLGSKAFERLLDVLGIGDRNDTKAILEGLKEFDTRRGREVHFADVSNEVLVGNKEELFYIYKELGLIDVHMPVDDRNDKPGFSDLIVLGGSFEACYRRVDKAAGFISPATRRVSGLSAFRPIPTRELEASRRIFSRDIEHPEHTEFEAMSDAFSRKFHREHIRKEAFSSSTNLNMISNVREFDPVDGVRYRVYASPSTSADRRASTMDTYEHFLRDVDEELCAEKDCRFLVITDNRYVTYQIIPLLICIFGSEVCDRIHTVDMIGCYDGKSQATKDTYDIAYINEVIATVEWIMKFKKTFIG